MYFRTFLQSLALHIMAKVNSCCWKSRYLSHDFIYIRSWRHPYKAEFISEHEEGLQMKLLLNTCHEKIFQVLVKNKSCCLLFLKEYVRVSSTHWHVKLCSSQSVVNSSRKWIMVSWPDYHRELCRILRLDLLDRSAGERVSSLRGVSTISLLQDTAWSPMIISIFLML